MGVNPWALSDKGDPRAVAIYDRHYSRRPSSIGKPCIAPPGRCLVLTLPIGGGLWVTSAQLPEFVKHSWPGAWLCTVFRNESAALSSTLVIAAVEATVAAWGPLPPAGFVTFVDAGKVRRKRDPGRCFLRAGWTRVGETRGGLVILRLSPCPQPVAVPAAGSPMTLWA